MILGGTRLIEVLRKTFYPEDYMSIYTEPNGDWLRV